MKRLIIISTLCSILITLAACSDDLSQIGSSTLPQGDGLSVMHGTVSVPTHTAYRDSVYVRTGYPLLGRIVDPDFGRVEASYLAQFYTSSEFGLDAYDASDSCTFDLLRTSAPRELGYDWDDFHYRSWDSLVGNRIDSMTLRIYYQTYYGDSLSPMQLSVYALNPETDFEALPEAEFYSNNDFSAYYSEANLLGRKAYTSANRELTDSVRSASGYMPYVEVVLTDQLKDAFYRAIVEAEVARDTDNPHHTEYEDVFASTEAFRRRVSSGVCIRPTFGDGSLIKVYYTAIYLFYSSFHKYDKDGTLLRNADDTADSTYVTNHVKYIAVTPDVIQMSGYQFADPHTPQRLEQPDTTYITTPQGYYTVIDLPVGQIINRMMDDPLRQPGDSSYFLNGATFYMQAYRPRGVLLNAAPTPTVLMVEEREMNRFFETGARPDSKTSCYASYVADSTRQDVYYYSFGNINSVILGLAEKYGWDKSTDTPIDADLTVPMAILPVELTTSTTSYTTSVLGVSSYILPTAIKMKRGDQAQQIQVIYSVEGTR